MMGYTYFLNPSLNRAIVKMNHINERHLVVRETYYHDNELCMTETLYENFTLLNRRPC